jgi:hypothetical protein
MAPLTGSRLRGCSARQLLSGAPSNSLVAPSVPRSSGLHSDEERQRVKERLSLVRLRSAATLDESREIQHLPQQPPIDFDSPSPGFLACPAPVIRLLLGGEGRPVLVRQITQSGSTGTSRTPHCPGTDNGSPVSPDQDTCPPSARRVSRAYLPLLAVSPKEAVRIGIPNATPVRRLAAQVGSPRAW